MKVRPSLVLFYLRFAAKLIGLLNEDSTAKTPNQDNGLTPKVVPNQASETGISGLFLKFGEAWPWSLEQFAFDYCQAAVTTRSRSRSNLARPYIDRLMSLRR